MRSGEGVRETASRFLLSTYPTQTHFRATHMSYVLPINSYRAGPYQCHGCIGLVRP